MSAPLAASISRPSTPPSTWPLSRGRRWRCLRAAKSGVGGLWKSGERRRRRWTEHCPPSSPPASWTARPPCSPRRRACLPANPPRRPPCSLATPPETGRWRSRAATASRSCVGRAGAPATCTCTRADRTTRSRRTELGPASVAWPSSGRCAGALSSAWFSAHASPAWHWKEDKYCRQRSRLRMSLHSFDDLSRYQSPRGDVAACR